MSVHLKRDLGISENYLNRVEDYPVSELMTQDLSAFKFFTLGEKAYSIEGKFGDSQKYFEKAVSVDSTFMAAYFRLAQSYLILGKQEQKDRALEKMMHYIYRVPEKIQFMAKNSYYLFKKERKKQFALVKMWTEVYPDDQMAREELAKLYIQNGEIDHAVNEYKHIMKGSGDEGGILERIGTMYIDRADYQQALRIYEQYSNKSPTDQRSFMGLGKTYMAMGEFESAKINYEKAQLLDPANLEVKIQLASIESRTGNFDHALQAFEDLLADHKSPDERMDIHGQLEDFHKNRGQILNTIESSNSWLIDFKKSSDYYEPIYHWERAYQAFLYVTIGKTDTTFSLLNDVKSKLGLQNKHIYSTYFMHVFLFQQNPDSAEKYVDAAGFGYDRASDRYLGKAIIHELRGEFDQAIENYEKCRERRKFEKEELFIAFGRTYRTMKKYNEAEDLLLNSLKISPYHARTLFELAQLYWQMDEKKKAKEFLDKTLDIWKDADHDYIPAMLARRKIAEWAKR